MTAITHRRLGDIVIAPDFVSAQFNDGFSEDCVMTTMRGCSGKSVCRARNEILVGREDLAAVLSRTTPVYVSLRLHAMITPPLEFLRNIALGMCCLPYTIVAVTDVLRHSDAGPFVQEEWGVNEVLPARCRSKVGPVLADAGRSNLSAGLLLSGENGRWRRVCFRIVLSGDRPVRMPVIEIESVVGPRYRRALLAGQDSLRAFSMKTSAWKCKGICKGR